MRHRFGISLNAEKETKAATEALKFNKETLQRKNGFLYCCRHTNLCTFSGLCGLSVTITGREVKENIYYTHENLLLLQKYFSKE